MFGRLCVLSLFLSPCCLAISAPNCPIIRGVACTGTAANTFIQGSSTSEVLSQLASRFCGCTYIDGNLAIQLSPQGDVNLTEDSFAPLYHLREISGYLHFSNIPEVNSVTLPNLRVIRGQTTLSSLKGPVSLLVENSNIGSLNLPSLTEISNGGATFVLTNGMCSFLGVNWADILNNGQLDYSFSGCTESNTNCTSCSSGHCWSSSPLYCQTLTKTACPQGCGRCFQSSADGSYKCCSSMCSAGCSGPTSDQCYACSVLNNNGSCVTQCPPAQVYDPVLFKLVNNPDYRLASGGLCVQQCTGNLLEYMGTCVSSCPAGYTSNNGAKCVACSGVCPRVCAGTDTNGVTAANIAQFSNCTIVNGSLFISDASLNGGTNLEVLSTIQEIQGALRIQNLKMLSSFPYLRNLKKIGFPGAALNLSINGSLCRPGGYQPYSLVLSATSLQSIDLSSLEEIQYGGYVLGNNPSLCYVGNFTRHLANRNYIACLSSTFSRSNASACIANGFLCHSQCNSNFSCWGPSDTQCDGCKNFVYNHRCVAQCSDVILSSGSSGIYQNNNSLVCEDCDSQCLGGCVNGMDPYNCISCRNFILTTQIGPLCVASCPQGTYANGSMCISCYQGCTMGCAGPLPYLNLTNGCLKCSYIQLDQLGQQVSCHSSSCPKGTYSSSASTSKNSIFANSQPLQSIIQDTTTLCLPCDDLCASCTGPGNASCTTCRYAKRLAQCVSGCNNVTEYMNTEMFCQPCASECIGCTGPSIGDCVVCVSDSCSSTGLQSSAVTGIVLGCMVAIFLVSSIVLVLVIVYRRYEHKVLKRAISVYYTKKQETLRPPKMAPNATRLIITPETSLQLGQVLGSGAFGTVYKGQWRPEGDPNCYEVAIKVLKSEAATPQSQSELLQEGVVMATMDNINVVRLYCVSMGKQMMLVTEFVRMGSLLSYLKKNQTTLDARTMLNFSMQIAEGMAYLEEKRMVHRDLAARNVLVHTPQLVKITDFGLTRIIDVGETHYTATGGLVPLRWMAPESIFQFEYTHKSDVWSFGVTIWEILTYGRLPYGEKKGNEIMILLKSGHRLEQPTTCGSELYHLLGQCWLYDQNQRPTFTALSEYLSKMLLEPTRHILISSASLETDPIVIANSVYDLAPNYQQDVITSVNSAYHSQTMPPDHDVIGGESSDCDYI